MPYFFEKYAFSVDETKYSDNISQVSLCGEQPKPNVDEVDILLIWVLVNSLFSHFICNSDTFTWFPY